jgi:hypothetical protein
MDEDFTLPTQPSGALVPPPKIPGTAVAAATPAPQPAFPHARHTLRRPGVIRRLTERVLDAVDEIADGLALGLGLRHK